MAGLHTRTASGGAARPDLGRAQRLRPAAASLPSASASACRGAADAVSRIRAIYLDALLTPSVEPAGTRRG